MEEDRSNIITSFPIFSILTKTFQGKKMTVHHLSVLPPPSVTSARSVGCTLHSVLPLVNTELGDKELN